MPSKARKSAAGGSQLASIPKEVVDQFVQGPMTGEAINDACLLFKKALIERALRAEMGLHPGYPPGAAEPAARANQRNGSTGKAVLTDTGKLCIEVPRERDGSFAPRLIPKHERRFTGFDDEIIGLYARGVGDTLIAVTDGLKGMSETLAAVYPATTPQTCIVHLVRNSLDDASWKDRKPLAAAIRPIYTAATAEAAEAELDAFEASAWGQKFPTVVTAWRRAWDRVIPFFAFPPEVRRVIYTTNAIESVNGQVGRIIKTRGHFPTDDAALKPIWLALRNITAIWDRCAHHWKEAMNQFAILYADHFVRPAA